jgi:hypothetical protein
MIRMRFPVVCVMMTVASVAAGAETRLQQDGINLSVTTLADRVVFCIAATGDLKVSSEYGVEFKTDRKNRKYWSETLPKIVTGAPYYFDLPLRIELKTRTNARERPITVGLGACSSAANACVPITFELKAPLAIQDASTVECAAQKTVTSAPAW